MSDTVTEAPGWALQHTPAAATVATISAPAVATGRNVCRSITISMGGTGANATAIVFVLRDGATGAGTIKWTAMLSNLANTSNTITITCNIPGSKNTAMTLECTQPAANSLASVAMDGYVDYNVV